MKRQIMAVAVVACLELVAGWGQVAAADGFLLDHFQCYGVQSSEENNVNVELSDQFGETFQVARNPALFCTPVTKCVVESQECVYPEQPDAHLTCYRLDPTNHVNQNVTVFNQFGEYPLTVTGSKLLCVPSTLSSGGDGY